MLDTFVEGEYCLLGDGGGSVLIYDCGAVCSDASDIFRPSTPLTQEQQAELASGSHFPFFQDGVNHGALYVCDEDGK